jgi:integrase/recombinase XerD
MNTAEQSYFPGISPRTPAGKKRRKDCSIYLHHDSWPDLWKDISISLQRSGYQQSTEFFYRHIIRKLSRFAGKSPREITPSDMRNYIRSMGSDSCTWHWTAMNISVLRTVFDKLGGMNIFQHVKGPRRKRLLPEYLNRDHLTRLFGAATTLRDQLLLALMYGCGLKVSEIQQLRWQNINHDDGILSIPSRHDDQVVRRLPLPQAVIPIIKEGLLRCPPEQLIFAGARANSPLTVRAIENVVSRCAAAASLPQNITPMTLRHSFAIHTLEAGATIRYLQEALDHQLVETTMRYLDCVKSPVTVCLPADTTGGRPVAPPQQVVTISETVHALNASTFPMTDPRAFFLSALKTRFTRYIPTLRRYFNSG